MRRAYGLGSSLRRLLEFSEPDVVQAPLFLPEEIEAQFPSEWGHLQQLLRRRNGFFALQQCSSCVLGVPGKCLRHWLQPRRVESSHHVA